MAAPFTSDPAEIAARWRPLTTLELGIATQLLYDAAALLAARLPTIAARALAGTLDPLLVVRAQVAMVVRVLSNPDGKRQESIDDYSWTRDNAVSAGLLYIGDSELTDLLPVRARARSVVLQTHSTYR